MPLPPDNTVVKNTLRGLGPPDHLQYGLDRPFPLVGGRDATVLVQHDDGRRPARVPNVVAAADEAAPVGEDDDVLGRIRAGGSSCAALS